MVVIAVSDVHIGCKESNVSQFKTFLNQVENFDNLEHFVIIGDFIDMWRRDASGLFLENHEILQSLMRLKNKKVGIHYVAGNHDFHLLKLKGHDYPLTFEESVSLKIEDLNYVFKHGFEFDCKQSRSMCELMCYNFSDEAGNLRSNIWKFITGRPDLIKELKGTTLMADAQTSRNMFDTETVTFADIENLMKPPNERIGCEELTTSSNNEMVEFANPLRSVEDNAAASVEAGKVLVFGHTHRPFINADGRLINTGSWMSNEKTTNTYIAIDGKAVKLMQFDGEKGNDITKSMIKSYKVHR